MKKRLYGLLSLLGLGCLLVVGCQRVEAADRLGPQPLAEEAASETLLAMDTVMELTPYGPEAETALQAASQRVMELEELFSVTRTDSEVYAINQSAGEWTPIQAETLYLLHNALTLGERSEGALDISIYPVVKAWGFTTDTYQVPDETLLAQLLTQVDFRQIELDEAGQRVRLKPGMAIDLGSLAKGYAGDQIMAVFRECGVTSAIINLGGNIQTLGTKPGGQPWRVAVQAPDGQTYAGILETADQAVVTSAGYERYFEQDGVRYWHILDPHSGRPAESGALSVTVVGESGMLCDALSTLLFVLGPDAASDYWRREGGFDLIMLTENGEVWVTEGLADRFVLTDEWAQQAVKVLTR